MTKPYNGIRPVAPAAFHPDGSLDADGNHRILECMIDQKVDGICVLANYSEQFLVSGAERDQLTRLSLEHIDGRVPVMVTISPFATDIVMERARQCKAVGADIVMMIPPIVGSVERHSRTKL